MMRSTSRTITGTWCNVSPTPPRDDHPAGAAVQDAAGPDAGTRVRSVDVAALHALHAPALRRFCLRLTRDRTGAEDLEQETFARFMARLPHLDPAVNVGAYLQATARNLYVKGLRNASREVADDLIEEHVGCDDDLERDPSRSLLLAEQIQQMRRSARRLNGRQRRAIVLREVDGRSYTEIADALGISEDAVAQTISRARVRLRSEYRREAVPAVAPSRACAALQDALSSYLDGRLRGAPRDDVEQHLRRCPACREVLAGYREAGVRLRAGAPVSSLAVLAERVSLALHGATSQAAGGLAVVAGGAAIVVAGAGGLVVAHRVAPGAAPSHAATAPAGSTTGPSGGAPGGAAPGGSGDAALAAPGPSAAGDASGAVHAGAPSGGGDGDRSVGGATGSRAGGAPGGATSGAGGGLAPPSTEKVVAKLRTPTIETPAVSTPKLTTPHVTVPAATTPAIKTPVATVPPVTTPKVELPPVTVPDVSVPPVTVPPVSLPVPKLPKPDNP